MAKVGGNNKGIFFVANIFRKELPQFFFIRGSSAGNNNGDYRWNTVWRFFRGFEQKRQVELYTVLTLIIFFIKYCKKTAFEKLVDA